MVTKYSQCNNCSFTMISTNARIESLNNLIILQQEYINRERFVIQNPSVVFVQFIN